MKSRFLIIIAIGMIGFTGISESFSENLESTEDSITWDRGNYRIINGTGTAKIIVTDYDKNQNSFFSETVNVFVYSDSFPEGIMLELYETEKSSGTFERAFSLSDNRSAPSILYVQNGDTVIAIYSNEPLPSDYLYKTIDLTATVLIGSTGPPLERAPVSNARIADSFGNHINDLAVGEQIQISSDVANGQNHEQKFAYLVQIQDDTGTTESLAWIDGTLNPGSSFSPSSSWIPQKEGDYTATMFVWESIDNPTALSPPISLGFTIISADEKKARQSESGNYKEMFMFIIPQNEFKQFTDIDLRTLYYYKVSHQELSFLPRLSLLVNMIEDFPYQSVSDLKLRISDGEIKQYDLFFEQKCKEQRPYAVSDDCIHTAFAFEYDEEWYYIYPKLAPHKNAIEDSKGNFDSGYFTRQ